MAKMSAAARKNVEVAPKNRQYLGEVDTSKVKIAGFTVTDECMPTGDASFGRTTSSVPARVIKALDNDFASEIRDRILCDAGKSREIVFGSPESDEYNVFCTINNVRVNYGLASAGDRNNMSISFTGAWTIQVEKTLYPLAGVGQWATMWCSVGDTEYAVETDCMPEYLCRVFSLPMNAEINEETLALIVGKTFYVMLDYNGDTTRTYINNWGEEDTRKATWKVFAMLPGNAASKALGIEYIKAGFGSGKPTAEQEKARKEFLARLEKAPCVEHKSEAMAETFGVDNSERDRHAEEASIRRRDEREVRVSRARGKAAEY